MTDDVRRELDDARGLLNGRGRPSTAQATIGTVAFHLANIVATSAVMYELSGSKTKWAAGIIGLSNSALGGSLLGWDGLSRFRTIQSDFGDGEANLIQALGAAQPNWVAAVPAANGQPAVPAGFDIDGDGEADLFGGGGANDPAFQIGVNPNPNNDEIGIIMANGLFAPLPNNGQPEVINGEVGWDMNDDGVIDLPVPNNAEFRQDPDNPGVLALFIPAPVAGGEGQYLPLGADAGLEIAVNALGALVVMIGDKEFPIDADMEWGFHQPQDGGAVQLQIGGVNVALPAGWELVPPAAAGGAWGIDIGGGADADDFNPVVEIVDGNLVINLDGVADIPLPVGEVPANVPLPAGAAVVVDANGGIGLDLDGDNVVDVPIGADVLVFGDGGVGIMRPGDPAEFEAVDFPPGAVIGYDAVNENYYVVVNGVQHNIGGDMPANAVVGGDIPGGGVAPGAGNVGIGIQFGPDGPVFQMNVPAANVDYGPAPDPLPDGVPANATPVREVELPGGGVVEPAAGTNWYVTVALFLISISAGSNNA